MPRKKKVYINSLRSLNQYRQRILPPNAVKQDIIDYLTREGKRIIELAYASRGFENRTGNLHDSYVSAVFDNGHLVKNSVRYLSGEELSKKDMGKGIEYENSYIGGETEYKTGREEAEAFLHKWQFSKGRPGGIQLVVAAAMFYSGIVESHGYSVLANIDLDMQNLARQNLSGTKYLSHIKLDEITEPSIYREDGKGRMQVIN